MERCETATPLGRPVEPEVWMTYARWSGSRPARSGFVSGRPAHAASSASKRTTGTSHPSNRAADEPCARIATGPLSARR